MDFVYSTVPVAHGQCMNSSQRPGLRLQPDHIIMTQCFKCKYTLLSYSYISAYHSDEVVHTQKVHKYMYIEISEII